VRVLLLGTSAGGGLPQWNCGCDNCRAAREGRLPARTQDSVAISVDGASWVLLNASPDIREQLQRTAALHPRGARHTPIAAIVLTNGDLDHVLGLFSLREWQPLTVLATDAVCAGLETNSMINTLRRTPEQLTMKSLPLDAELECIDGLWVRAIAVPGKPPLHLRDRVAACPGDDVALLIRDRDGKKVLYASTCAAIGPLLPHLDVDLLLFDGTFQSEDELAKRGLGSTTASQMFHAPLDRSLALIETRARKVLVHINNSNPILDPGSSERAEAARLGWEVLDDGAELEL
jgi:pyrroloquinoline quinone biosynthesis protein B